MESVRPGRKNNAHRFGGIAPLLVCRRLPVNPALSPGFAIPFRPIDSSENQADDPVAPASFAGFSPEAGRVAHTREV